MDPRRLWSSGPEEQAPQRLAGATRYQCAEGKQFAVRYGAQGQNWAMLILPEREFRLEQMLAASGVRYSNGRTTLVTKDDEAQLDDAGGTPYANCKRAV
jgi:membrane-bound inhibitor of C-type lysozyme